MTYNTLHLCHSMNIDFVSDYIELIGENDAVVFYELITDNEKHIELKGLMKPYKTYFILENKNDYLQTITYDDWLKLVNQYKKTFTWK